MTTCDEDAALQGWLSGTNSRIKTKKTTVIMGLHVTSAYADIWCKYMNVDEEDSKRGEDVKATVGPERATLTGSCIDRGFLCRNWSILGITNDEPFELSSQVGDSCHDGFISDASS